jgi:multidrug efflux pump subunit AcrB
MRDYGKTGMAELVLKGMLALVVIIVLVQFFKGIFAIIAALLTIAIIGIGVLILMNLLSKRRY